jgi:hypothetical protein
VRYHRQSQNNADSALGLAGEKGEFQQKTCLKRTIESENARLFFGIASSPTRNALQNAGNGKNCLSQSGKVEKV